MQKEVRESADQAFARLKENPQHPSLQFKKVGMFWSVRIGLAFRALAVREGNDFIWVWIGSHDDYGRMIRKR